VGVSSAVLLSGWLAGTPTTVSTHLLESAISAAIGGATAKAVPALVFSLTQGVLRTMWIRKLCTNGLAILAIGATSGGLAVWAHWPSATTEESA
jgi:hypothetical protein